MLEITAIPFSAAAQVVTELHRHHKKPVGHKFSLACWEGEKLVGVAIVGRPVARGLDNGKVLEITRLCTDGTRNACSKLYAAARREARKRGYERIITYILETENGASLRAAGFVKVYVVKGRSWNCESRNRTDKHPTSNKTMYEGKI